jgi:pimeloyl-ACP methyl ester carboxylesterase
MIIYVAAGSIGAFLLLSLYLTYLVHALPRHPVVDPPDWGTVQDVRVTAVDGGYLEVWRIEPDQPSKGIVVLVHGWGRNRDRMVRRARVFGRLGFTTVLPSVRDHGGSSRCRFMNAVKFAQDIEAVLGWLGEPVILYGHSAGSGGAIIAAERHPSKVKALFLEASYAHTKEALLSLYRWFNRPFGIFFGPIILFWMDLFYRGRLDTVSPAILARKIRMPVLLIHGEKDRRFPLTFAKMLLHSFPEGNAELFIAKGAGHSEASFCDGFPEAIAAFLARHAP